MRKLKHLYVSVVLTLALSITAFGGEMQTPSVSTPPPPPTYQSSVTGSTDTIGATFNETSNSDVATKASVTEITLYLFDSMLYMLF